MGICDRRRGGGIRPRRSLKAERAMMARSDSGRSGTTQLNYPVLPFVTAVSHLVAIAIEVYLSQEKTRSDVFLALYGSRHAWLASPELGRQLRRLVDQADLRRLSVALHPTMKRAAPSSPRGAAAEGRSKLVRCQRGSDLRLLRCGAVTAHDGRAVDAGLA
jgi:hypothetical protein